MTGTQTDQLLANYPRRRELLGLPDRRNGYRDPGDETT